MVEEELSGPQDDEQRKVRKAKINAVWEQLNARESAIIASKAKNVIRAAARGESNLCKTVHGEKGSKQSTNSSEWMSRLGISAKKHSADARPSTGASNIGDGNADSRRPVFSIEVENKNEDKEVARQIAASALAAAKAAAAVSTDVKPTGANAGGQPEPSNFLDPSRVSETNKRKAQMQATASSGLDALLEQIGKKQKGNILDRSRKDWGEFKEEKGFEEELEAYKKSGDKYLDKVAFLQRADLREYEKERDARLAYQAKRRLETPSFTET